MQIIQIMMMIIIRDFDRILVVLCSEKPRTILTQYKSILVLDSVQHISNNKIVEIPHNIPHNIVYINDTYLINVCIVFLILFIIIF
jgi:hypothetical protein